jgi:hypothetical protein
MVCQWFDIKTIGTVCQWFSLKTTRTVFSGLASKPVVTVSPDLASKPVVDFLVEHQNQGGGGFPGLGLKTMWVMVCRLRLKTDGRMRRRGARIEI